MTIQEQRRANFEVFMTDLGWGVRRMTGSGREFYDDTTTQVAWRAWNAALDSVVIELPKNDLGTQGEDRWKAKEVARNECRRSIESAGIKVK